MHTTLPWVAVWASLRRFVARLLRRGGPDDGPDLLGSGVPRRPSPGGLIASAAATPESDGR
jgi:hypothetical protein